MMSFHMHTMKLPEAIPWISHSISMCPCIFHYIVSHCLWLSINYSLSMSMYKSPIIYIYIYVLYSLSTATVCFPSKLPLIIPWFPMVPLNFPENHQLEVLPDVPSPSRHSEDRWVSGQDGWALALHFWEMAALLMMNFGVIVHHRNSLMADTIIIPLICHKPVTDH